MEALQPRAEGQPPKQTTPPDFSKKSFAQMFAKEPQQHLLEFPLSVHKGEVAIKIPAAAIDKLAIPFKHALVGKFSHGRPTLEDLRKTLAKLDFNGALEVGLIDYRHVLLRFHSEADFHRIWTRGIWQIGKFPMRVFKWSPTFQTSRETSIVPVWFELPGLPCHLFDHGVLFSIMKAVGVPLSVDAATLNLTRPSVARVNVEIDLMREVPPRIWIEHGDDGEGFWQRINPENLPRYCSSCFRQGHSNEGCTMHENRPQIHENRSQKNWKPKANAVVNHKPSTSNANAASLPSTSAAGAASMPSMSAAGAASIPLSLESLPTTMAVVRAPAADLTAHSTDECETIMEDERRKVADAAASDVVLAAPARSSQDLGKTMVIDVEGRGGSAHADSVATHHVSAATTRAVPSPRSSRDLPATVGETTVEEEEGRHTVPDVVHAAAASAHDAIAATTATTSAAPSRCSTVAPADEGVKPALPDARTHAEAADTSGKQDSSTLLVGALSVALSGQHMGSTNLENPLSLAPTNLALHTIAQVSAQKTTDWDHAFQTIAGNILSGKEVLHENLSDHTHATHQFFMDTCFPTIGEGNMVENVRDLVDFSGQQEGSTELEGKSTTLAAQKFTQPILGVEDRNAELQLAWKNLLLSSQNSPGTNATKEFIDSVPRNEEPEPGRSIQRGDRYDGLNNAWQNLVSSNAYEEVVEFEQMGEAFHSGIAPPEDDKKRKHGMSDRVLRSMVSAYNSDPSRASSL